MGPPNVLIRPWIFNEAAITLVFIVLFRLFLDTTGDNFCLLLLYFIYLQKHAVHLWSFL